MKTTDQSLIGQIYKHYRNQKTYEITAIGFCNERDIEVIIYKPLYPCEYEYFTRSHGNFFSQVEHEGKIIPRFERV